MRFLGEESRKIFCQLLQESPLDCYWYTEKKYPVNFTRQIQQIFIEINNY